MVASSVWSVAVSSQQIASSTCEMSKLLSPHVLTVIELEPLPANSKQRCVAGGPPVLAVAPTMMQPGSTVTVHSQGPTTVLT